MDIIAELKKQNLLGRSGSNFPTGLKWEMVKKQKSDKKYIICNASEGEPLVYKDYYILKNHLKEVEKGIEIAAKTIGKSQTYFYLNPKYYPEFSRKIKKSITPFKKEKKYIAGEETSAIEAIEGKKPEPRIKPPYPTEKGLFGKPTLINNVETFYYAFKIFEKEYNQERFYSIEGDIKNKGVFELNKDLSIEDVLRKTNNWPNFKFFVQAGGGISGEIFLPSELKRPVPGIGSLIIYNSKTDLYKLIEKWAYFLIHNNCDKCVPCREGLLRVYEIIQKKDFKNPALKDLFFVLEKTSFCALGKYSVNPFKSLIKKWNLLKSL